MYEIICAGPHSGFCPIPGKEETSYIIFKDEVPVGRTYPVNPGGLYGFVWAQWVQRYLVEKLLQLDERRFHVEKRKLYFSTVFPSMQFLTKGQLLAFFEVYEAMKFLVESDQKISDKTLENYKHAFFCWSHELSVLQHFESENEFYRFRGAFSQKEECLLIRFLTTYDPSFIQ